MSPERFIDHVLRASRQETDEMTSPPRILVVRLGSMGDVIAALPAVASLKHSIPHSKITWVIDPKWSLLLEGNPYVDSVVHLDRRTFTGLRNAWRELRAERFDFAVDFQGLVKSALVATLARPERIFGFNAAVRARIGGVLVLFDQGAHPLVSRGGTESGSGGRGGSFEHSAHISFAARRAPSETAGRRFRAGQSAGRVGRQAMAARILCDGWPNGCGANAGCRWCWTRRTPLQMCRAPRRTSRRWRG